METNGTTGMNGTNKRIAWFSVAGLALLGAVTVYALTNSGNVKVQEGDPAAAIGGSGGDHGAAASITVPAGTALAIILETTLSTKTADVGDRFTARLDSPVRVSGTTVIPAGAEVSGHVAMTDQPGKTSGRGRMQLAYDTIRYGGRSYDLGTVGRIYESKSGRGKDAAIIGGGAVAGGVAGAILGGSAGDAGKGAAAGAVAGTAVTLATRGPQLELPSGTRLEVSLDRAVTVRPKATT